MKYQRVILVSHELSFTGSPRSLYNLACVLRQLGKEITVWSLEDGPFRSVFENNGFTVEVIEESLQTVKDRITMYDLAILNTVFTAVLIEQFQSKIRTILYLREGENISSIIEDCSISSSCISMANEIWTVSLYSKKVIDQLFAPPQVCVIHNYVKNLRLFPLNFVKDKTIHFIVSGTLEYRKGIDLVIEAFSKMPDFLRNKSVLHIVGNAPKWSELYWKPLLKKLDEKVIYHGYITDDSSLMQLYEKMNVFIIPSRDEPCSLVALEGAMLGRAVLMSENVGAIYLDPKCSGVFPVDDVSALSRKMCEYTSRRKMFVQGMMMRVHYIKTSTKKQFVKRLVELLDEK
jgi:glycosyltransferase involved in cell wall biosynthesis